MSKAQEFMSVLDRLASLEGSSAELLPIRLAKACAEVLPADAAGLSLFTSGGIRVPIGASDDAAALAERLQFTIGQGPCIEAHTSRRIVLADDATLAEQWPMFHGHLIANTPIRSITAAPMPEPLAGLGTVDLYFHRADAAAAVDLDDVAAVLRQMAALLLEGLSTAAEPGESVAAPGWLDRPSMNGREQVIVAMGMLNVAFQLSSEGALDVLRAHAYSTDRTVDEVARSVVSRELSLAELDPGQNR